MARMHGGVPPGARGDDVPREIPQAVKCFDGCGTAVMYGDFPGVVPSHYPDPAGEFRRCG